MSRNTLCRKLRRRNSAENKGKNFGPLRQNINCHLIKRPCKTPDINGFHITGKGFIGNTFKREITESFLMKDMRPTLNKRESS